MPAPVLGAAAAKSAPVWVPAVASAASSLFSGLFGGGDSGPVFRDLPVFGKYNQDVKGETRQVGFGTLLDILQSQGRTDPRLFNRQVASIDRGTQQQQQATQGNLAQAGLQGSGMGQLLSALQGMAGEDRQAALMADEMRLAEERKRSDLDLLLQLVMNPSLQRRAIASGVSANNAQINAQRSQDNRSAALGALQGLFSALYGNQG